MTETIYGYVRVSTQEQHEARQLDAMRKFGVEEQNIIVEKVSGKDFNRPLYQQLVKKLRPEDVLVVKSIDRLGRNYDEILEQWGVITKKRKAAIVVLDMPLLDTRQGRDLTGTLISDTLMSSTRQKFGKYPKPQITQPLTERLRGALDICFEQNRGNRRRSYGESNQDMISRK